jgi:hypothetical protein
MHYKSPDCFGAQNFKSEKVADLIATQNDEYNSNIKQTKE